MTRSLLLSAALVTGWGLSGLAQAADDSAATRDLTLQQTQVHTISAPAPTLEKPLQVVAWVDQEDNTYAIGEQVSLFVQTTKPAYVMVLNVGPTGNTTILYPNAAQPNNHVPANTPVQVPGPGMAITVNGPVGTELIKVVASTQPIAMFGGGQTAEAGPFRSVTAPVDTWSRDLAVTMTAPTPTAATVTPTATATATATLPQAAPTGSVEWDDYNKVIHTVAGAGAAGQGAATPAQAWSHQVSVTQPFTLTLASEKTAYAIGEPIQAMVTVNRTCHLTLTNTTASGQVRLIYPNAAQPNTLVQAGQTIVVPGNVVNPRLTALGPRGPEHLVASCSETPPAQTLPVAQNAYPFVAQTVLVSAGVATRDLSLTSTAPTVQPTAAQTAPAAPAAPTGPTAVAILPLMIQ